MSPLFVFLLEAVPTSAPEPLPGTPQEAARKLAQMTLESIGYDDTIPLCDEPACEACTTVRLAKMVLAQ